jgi:hypothetical protein
MAVQMAHGAFTPEARQTVVNPYPLSVAGDVPVGRFGNCVHAE